MKIRTRSLWSVARRHAFALIGILIVIMLASMVALSLLFRMRGEELAAGAGDGSESAWAAAMAGVQETLRVAADSELDSLEWQDSPGLFKDRLVFEDGADQWFFTVYSPGEGGEAIRFGLTDEAGKVNVNEAGRDMLSKLPGMSLPLAQTLWDFLDANNEPEPDGAEQEYYDTLGTPYAVRNGPLDTIDELLLVRGFTPALVYGEDANMNCMLDPNEDDGTERNPPDNKDGQLSRGLRDLVTMQSYDLNYDNDLVPRTNINDPDDPLYTNGLPESVVHYITALRSNKLTVLHVADLLEAKTTIKDAKGAGVVLESGVGKEELPAVLDLLSADAEEVLPGLININTARAEVLQAIPGIDASTAESIVSTRRNLPLEKRRSMAWLFQEGLVDADTFKSIAPYITTRTWQFSFYVVGYGLPSGRYRVLEVMIDLGGDEPAVTYLRDISRLGLPFPLLQEAEPFASGRKSIAGSVAKSEQVGPLFRRQSSTTAKFAGL